MSVGRISATESGGNGTLTGYATASLTAYYPPQITKTYSPDSILTGGTSHLTYVITNPNSFNNLTGINFTDTYAGTMSNTSPLNIITNTCVDSGSATITPIASGGGTSFEVPSGEDFTLAGRAELHHHCGSDCNLLVACS